MIKVAIVHDWLTNQGGGERVVAALHRMFPEAPIYTSVYKEASVPALQEATIVTSFLQHLPLARRKHQLFPVLRRYAFESFDFSDFDVVISSSSAEAKGVITSSDTLHISYIHTPTRYYWSGYQAYLANPGFGLLDPLARAMLKKNITSSRYWDYAAAQRPDVLVANSQTVAARIANYYKRSAVVISPPVELQRFSTQSPKQGDYYLVVSRLIPYKRVDLAVRACMQLSRPLKVVGQGSELRKLKKLAGPTIQFVEDASDNDVAQLYLSAKAFIFAGFEDFGITPVEAMAAGKPVIAYAKGGSGETVVEEKTGILFEHQTVEDLVQAIVLFEQKHFSPVTIRKRAKLYSEASFSRQIATLIDTNLKKK